MSRYTNLDADNVRSEVVETTTLKIGGNWKDGSSSSSTISGTELGYLDAVTAGTLAASKAVVVAASTKRINEMHIGTLYLGAAAGTAVTATAAEISKLAGVTAGTLPDGKAIVVAATTKRINEMHIGTLYLGAAAGTALSATAAELNKLNGVTAGTVTAAKGVVVAGTTKRVNEWHVGTLYLGAAAGTAVTKTITQVNSMVTGLAAGYVVARGTMVGTASATAATGLGTIVSFAVTAIGTTGTAVNAAAALTAKATGANLVAYRWKMTGPSTATLTAASVAGTVAWVAIGVKA